VFVGAAKILSAYLSADELADLVGCKRNQRSAMTAWLTANRWAFAIDCKGMPKVALAHHDRQMGIIGGAVKSKFADEPNRDAFKRRD